MVDLEHSKVLDMLEDAKQFTGCSYCVLVNVEWITGDRHGVLVGTKQITGQITGYSGHT